MDGGWITRIASRAAKKSAVAAAVGAIALGVTAAADSGTGMHGSGGIGPRAIARLVRMARSQARLSGDRVPASAIAVATTGRRAFAALAAGDSMPEADADAVYLVTMTGHFTGNQFSTPYGAPAPTGTVFSIVIDAKTFRVLSISLGPRAPHLRGLGQLVKLTWR